MKRNFAAMDAFPLTRAMPPYVLNIKGQAVVLDQPKIMGILNITPDSFSDGGKFFCEDAAVAQAGKLIADGAWMIDIGAQSSRPGAVKIAAEEEIRRLGAIISEIKKAYPEILISLDTFYGKVVDYGVEQGIDVINDISAMRYDADMKAAVIRSGLPYILMHGNPTYEQMHAKFPEEDMLLKINLFFAEYIHELYEAGVRDVIIDPGFGFGKTPEQQYRLIEECGMIGFGKWPILAGISRKSFIRSEAVEQNCSPEEWMEAQHLKLLQGGIKILRVHDVQAARRTIEKFLNS